MLRIGNFQSGYPEPDGITSAVQGLSKALSREGHTVVIYGYGRTNAGATLPADVQVIHFDAPGNPFSAPADLRSRLKANVDRLDLLVIHGMFNPPNIAVAACAASAGIPYVICPHCPYDPELLGKHGLRKATYGFLFEKPELRRAAAVQVFCRKHARLLQEYGIETPAIVVPNGFDPVEVPRDIPVETSPLAGDPKLLFLGRLDSHHKGIDLLIRAFARVLHAELIPSTSVLTLVGPDAGDNRDLQRLVADRQVSSNVVFMGKVVDPARWQVLRSCDLFLLGSRYDGFAMAVTEAMLAGKPLLLSEKTANADWIREADCAWIVEPTIESLGAGLIEAVQKRSQWPEMGARAKQFAAARLTWNRAAAAAADQYALVLERLRNGIAPARVAAASRGGYA